MVAMVGPLVSKPGFCEAEVVDEAVRYYDRNKRLTDRLAALERENVELKKEIERIVAENQKEISILKQEVRSFLKEAKKEMEKIFCQTTAERQEIHSQRTEEMSLRTEAVTFDNGKKVQVTGLTACQLYEKGKFYDSIKDFPNAFSNYKRAAEKGHIEAQYITALRYSTGNGVAENPKEALCWMNRAAENNYRKAMFELGTYYEKGYGIEKNLKRAERWYEKAAEHGCADARQALKHLLQYDTQSEVSVQTNSVTSVHEKNIQAEGMTAFQLYNQGKYYDKIKDVQNAFLKYRKAAEKGYVEAQYIIALRYSSGNGVTENPKEAFRWMNRAAENLYLDAMFGLGTYYEKGYGIEKNLGRAQRWYKTAAEHGSHDAKQALKYLSEAVEQEKLCKHLEGPNAVAISKTDATAPASIQSPIANFVRVISQIAESKEAQSGEPNLKVLKMEENKMAKLTTSAPLIQASQRKPSASQRKSVAGKGWKNKKWRNI